MEHCAAKNDFSNIPNLKMKRRMQLNTVKIGTKYAMFPKTKRTISERFYFLFYCKIKNVFKNKTNDSSLQ